MSTLNDLEPGSPEYEAEIERLQALEDAERDGASQADPEEGEAGDSHQDGEVNEGTANANAGDPPSSQDEAGSKPGAEPGANLAQGGESTQAAKPKVSGVATKDGSKVLPYSVLSAERQRSARLNQELENARRQIEELTNGKPAGGKPDKASTNASDELSDEDLGELASDFPQLAKLVGEIRETRELLRNSKEPKPAASGESHDETAGQGEQTDPTLDAIEQIPVLAGWMSNPADAELFARAQAIDKALETSPKWRNKPLVDRFKHVVKQVAEEFDMEVDLGDDSAPSQTQDTTSPRARRDPDAAIRAAKETHPNTLSDFKGGAPTEHGDPIKRLDKPAQVNRLMEMSDAEIDAWLARGG